MLKYVLIMRKAAGIVLLIIIYNLFFFPFFVPFPGHVDFLLFQSVVLVSLWLMFWPVKRSKQRGYAVITSSVAMAASILALYTANPVSAFGLGLVSFITSLIVLYLLLLKNPRFGGLLELAAIPYRSSIAWLSSFFHRSGNLGKLIRGLVVSIPILLITVGLLSSADPVFGSFVTKITSLPQDLMGRIFYSGLIMVGLIPLSAAVINTPFVSPFSSLGWKKYSVEIMTVLSLLAVILGVFLVIQFKYIFAAVPETELYQFGIHTYSEYVRRGFVEMILVTGIAYVVAAIGYMAVRNGGINKLKLINLVLLSETGVFILSIFRRVNLYQLHHGLTRIRFFGLVVVIYLFGLVVFLVWRHLARKKHPWYVYEILLGILLVFMTALVKPDAIISNRLPPTVNREIDYVYLSRLSIEALSGWIAAYRHAQEVQRDISTFDATPSAEQVRDLIYANQAMAELLKNYTKLEEVYGSSVIDSDRQYRWGSNLLDINLAEKRAYKTLQSEISLDDLKLLKVDLESYFNSLPEEVRSQPLDRSFDSPLL